MGHAPAATGAVKLLIKPAPRPRPGPATTSGQVERRARSQSNGGSRSRHRPAAQRNHQAATVILTLKWGHLLRFDPVDIDAWLDEARRGAQPA